MTDLVERLRDVRKRFESGTPQFTDQLEFLTSEAADEIERLQKQIFALRAAEVANQTLYRETKRMAGVEANNERLQAENEKITSLLARAMPAVRRIAEGGSRTRCDLEEAGSVYAGMKAALKGRRP